MARYTRRRSTASRSRSTKRTYRSASRARPAYGRKRTYSRSGSARSAGRGQTIRIVVEQVAPATAVGPSLLGLKKADAPRVAKF